MKNDEYAKIVSRNLRRLLYDCGRTQSDIARDLKIAKTTVNGWLNSNRIPRMDTVDKLAHYFNVTRSDILDDKNGYYEKVTHPETSRDISVLYAGLNERGKEEAIRYLQYLHTREDYKKQSPRFA